MKRLIFAPLAGALVLVSAACKETPPAAPATEAAPTAEAPAAPVQTRDAVTLRGKTMGTTWSVKAIAESPAHSERIVALQPKIEALLERVNDQMSTYRPESELSRFNKHSGKEAFPVSDATAQVTRRALEIGELTGGAFDVTLGPLISLWGFDAEGRRSAPPSAAELKAARARVGLAMLHVEDKALRKERADLVVNLSGIAKGWGVDKVFELLREEGVEELLVEIGGEVRAAGKNARGETWRLGVNVPRSGADPTSVLRRVAVKDRALATSGDYRNFFEAGGRRYSHIIDPTTGEPVQHQLVSVSVLAPDCTTADALATAGLVLGEERMRKAVASLESVELLFVHAPEGLEGSGDAALRVSQTAGFATLD
jgi:thiamine biosynthesis lipoprotein